jgi:hypothetical protein
MPAWLLNLAGLARRRRGRLLVGVAAVAIVCLAAFLIGRQVWALHHLRAAEKDIDHWKFASAHAHERV